MVLAVGTLAPSFSTVDDTGKEVSLADFKDNNAGLIVINLFHA